MGFWNFNTQRVSEDGAAFRGRAVCGTDLRGGRRGTGSGVRAAACALAAALAMLLGFAAPAQAQTATKQVSNTGQTMTHGAHFGNDWAQSFTTGSSAGGYKLTRVDMRGRNANATQPVYSVKIYSDSSNLPGTSLGTLTNPASLPSTDALVQFTSTAGIDLDANTKYWLVIDVGTTTGWATSPGFGDYLNAQFRSTTSTSDDTGAAAGWSIAATRYVFRGRTSTGSWTTTSSRRLGLAIYGYAKPQPKVTGVEISSTPSLDVDGDNTKETYGLGEKIQVQVTFDKNVTVTGTPRLKIDFSSEDWGEKWVNYESGSGTKVLTFAYTVVTPNVSTQGIAVLENTLALNGGTIKSGTVDAALTHTGQAHNAGHKVNSGLAPANTPKSPASQRPRFTSGFGPLRLEPDIAITPVTLPAATGGGGAPYTYVLTSSPAGLAGLSFDAGARTLSGTPEAEGRWTFTYAATDANGGTAILSFRVTVGVALEEQQQVVRRTLAEVASRTIAGAVANIGTRLGDAAPSPGMTIAGETVRFGGSGIGDGMACPPDAWGRAFETVAPGCAPQTRSRGVAADGLLPASAFSWTLGAAPGDKNGDKPETRDGEPGFDPDAPRWAVWGRGDFGSFEGRPDGISSYRGETRTGWLGVDAREAPRGSSGGSARPGRWVAGLAVSRGTSETDYTLDGEQGRIETGLTALWPYGRWTFGNGLELRGMLGAGRGEARHSTDDGIEEKSRLSMWTGSAGLRRPLPALAGIDLAARGDVSLARMQTAKGDGDEEQAVDGILADAWRLRGGVEASRLIPFDDGSSLTPFVETAARRDGGDGVTGTGIEVAGGLRVAAPGLQVEARGRWLAAHTEKGAEERGVSLTARAGPGAHGRGLSVVLSPRWGAPSGGSGALWREELPRGAASGAREAGALDGELGYGFGLLGGRLTGTPNVGFGQSDGGGRDYRLGWRLTPAVPGYAGFRVDLDATRREPANANEPPSHGAMLTGAIRW